MANLTFHQLRQLGRGHQTPAAPATSEIDPDAIMVLDGPAPADRPAAPAIGEVDPEALTVWPDDSAARKHLRDLIASKESALNDYNGYYKDWDNAPPPPRDVSKMTLAEIYAYQDRLFRSQEGTPVGRYQLPKPHCETCSANWICR